MRSVVSLLPILLLTSCDNGLDPTNEAPLVSMKLVPTVIAVSPREARELLEEAGFKVELTRPTAYCVPQDPLCEKPLDDEALTKLDVATQTGTQGKRRPMGSTITLILGSSVREMTQE